MPDMLRVLTLSTLYPDRERPGFGSFVERQTRALAAQDNVTVRVVAPVGMPPPPLRRARHRAIVSPLREERAGLIVERPRFTTLPGPLGRWNDRLLARALAPVLDRIRDDFPFDVIDAEFFWPDGPAAAALGARYGVPVSIKARGSDINRWSAVPAVRRRILAAAARADGLLAVSDALAGAMAAIGIRRDGIRTHYTGIDLDRFRPVDRAVGKAALGVGGPLFVTVGSLDANKGQHLVIAALAALPRAVLIIAGQGKDRAALEAQAAPLGTRVRFAGQLAPDALASLIASANALVQPSAREGLANVWVEALACGTPVIATRAGGIAEVLDRPAAGLIVDRDPTALATAMAAILASPPPQDEVRAAAERFSWERNGAELAAHLEALSIGERVP